MHLNLANNTNNTGKKGVLQCIYGDVNIEQSSKIVIENMKITIIIVISLSINSFLVLILEIIIDFKKQDVEIIEKRSRLASKIYFEI